LKVRLAVQRDVAERISVQELESPLQEAEQAVDHAEDDVSNHVSNTAAAANLVPRDGADLAQELDNGDEQAAQADGAEAVRQRAAGGATSRTLGEVVHAKVPGPVDARDGRVDSVFQPFGDPVHGKRDVDHEADQRRLAAPAPVGAAVGVLRRRLVLDVYRNHGDGEPGGKGGRDEAADQADEVDVAVFLAHVDGRLEHEGRKGDARNPRPKGEDCEQGKDEEDDAGGPVLLVEVEDGGAEGPADVEDARDPDELFRKRARKPHVAPREDKGDDEDEGEEDDGVAVEREAVIVALVDARAGAARHVAVDGDARDDDEARKGGEELRV